VWFAVCKTYDTWWSSYSLSVWCWHSMKQLDTECHVINTRWSLHIIDLKLPSNLSLIGSSSCYRIPPPYLSPSASLHGQIPSLATTSIFPPGTVFPPAGAAPHLPALPPPATQSVPPPPLLSHDTTHPLPFLTSSLQRAEWQHTEQEATTAAAPRPSLDVESGFGGRIQLLVDIS
jgi:hypothetical protein